ncbi:MAG: hypothetical protein ABII22_04360 [Candidatus Micrarchaeota archaeon]
MPEEKEDQNSKPKTEDRKQIASRGIPSSESLYFPPFNSEELRNFQDKDENLTRNLWSLEEVTNFVFSKKYQTRYYEIALGFLKVVNKKPQISGSDISEFIHSNSISKATFYNRVLPRLRRVGMIKIERETIVAVESKRKFRPMKISLSKTFGNYMMKIGDSWLAIVDDARTRKESIEQQKLRSD